MNAVSARSAALTVPVTFASASSSASKSGPFGSGGVAWPWAGAGSPSVTMAARAPMRRRGGANGIRRSSHAPADLAPVCNRECS